MSKKVGLQFFVEPLSERDKGYTNRYIGEELANRGLVNESISERSHSYRGKRINTFIIEREFALELLEKKKEDKLLQFNIYYSRYGEHNVHMWKGGKIIYDRKRGKLRVIPELDDKIKQSEKEMAETLDKLTGELSKYYLTRKLAKVKEYRAALAGVTQFSKLLSKNSKKLEKLLTPKPKKK